jgi:hypothetical protein
MTSESSLEMAAYFRFDCPPDPDTFVVKLEDRRLIAHARELISGKTQARPHVSGIIVKKQAAYNRPWRFHLAPKSISFFDNAVEVCDSTIRGIDEHLDEVGGAFLPGNRWCSWSSHLIEEAVAPKKTHLR